METMNEGQILRDQGIAKVMSNNQEWKTKCYQAVKTFLINNRRATGEDIRFYLQEQVGHPSHHNAWGGLINSMIKRGYLYPTGIYVPMKEKTSHARQTQVYSFLV